MWNLKKDSLMNDLSDCPLICLTIKSKIINDGFNGILFLSFTVLNRYFISFNTFRRSISNEFSI